MRNTRHLPAKPAEWESSLSALTRFLSENTYAAICAAAFVCLAGSVALQGKVTGASLFLLGLLTLTFLLARTFPVLRDWTPFVIIIFGWQLLRGYTDVVLSGAAFSLHVTPMITIDRDIFGGRLPTLMLQSALYDPGRLHWYDVAAGSVWACHFVLPVAFALLLWLTARRTYWQFAAALVVLSLAGFITYVIYPAAPPWIASQMGYISQPVHLIRSDVLTQLHVGPAVSWIFSHGSPDDYAAMPSLHASFPAMVLWFCIFYRRKLVPLAILYCSGMWFTIVYIGDHYVTDALVGFCYATIFFFVTKRAFDLTRNTEKTKLSQATAEQTV